MTKQHHRTRHEPERKNTARGIRVARAAIEEKFFHEAVGLEPAGEMLIRLSLSSPSGE